MSDFKVRVKSPLKSEGYFFPVSNEDTISTVKQYLYALGLLEQPISAFSLKFKGDILTNDTKIADLANGTAEVDLEMQLENTDLADISSQIERFREVLGLGELESTAVNSGATRLHEIKKGNRKGKKLSEDEIVELAVLPDFDLGGSHADADAPSLGGKGFESSLHQSVRALPNSLVPKPAAIELQFSRWQPLCRSPQTKLAGILAFVYLVSNDGKESHFVASSRGFAYVPGLSNEKLVLPSTLMQSLRFFPTLVQAVEAVSPSTVNAARKNAEKIKANPLACEPISQVSSVAPWLVGDVPEITSLHVSDFELPADNKNKDWNEDYQSARELETESFAERVMRDRSLCQTATGFASAAMEGAVKIVEGGLTALNPFEDVESAKFYLSNGIFYTHGSDFSQSYAGIDSENGARKAVKKGINGIEQLMLLNNANLCPVLTAVVDYCGRRLVAQAPVPGIFREVPLIVYGQSEDPEVVHRSEEIDADMEKFAKHVHLKKHPVDQKGTELQTSVEVHGAKSTDGRFYAIDLHRMQAPDLLFEGDNELDLLRFEAVVDFYKHNPDAEKLNPDVWLAADRFPEDYANSQLQKDIEAVKNVGRHVREKLIPEFIDNVSKGAESDPVDGIQLTGSMHRKGINMRHLGLVHELAKSAGLKSLTAVSFEEALARSLKYELRRRLEKVDNVADMAQSVEAFVSSFRGDQGSRDAKLIDACKSRMSRHFGIKEFSSDWTEVHLGRNSLLRLVSLKMGLQWDDSMKLVAINPTIRFSFPRSLTAADAIEAGRISLEAAFKGEAEGETENFEEKQEKEVESSESSEGSSSKESDESGAESSEVEPFRPSPEILEQTFAVITEAVGIYTQVYGTAHAEVAYVLNQVATLFYEYGNDTAKAIDYIRKAITIGERIKGVDSYDVLVMYTNLAYFEKSAGNWATTLQIYKRILEMIEQIAWPGHAEVHAAFGSVAVMLLQTHKEKLQRASLEWFSRAIELAKESPTGPSGMLWFQYAQAQIFQRDYKNAARSMEQSHHLFKEKHGSDDASTKEVKAYLEQLLSITVSTAKSEALAKLHEKTRIHASRGGQPRSIGANQLGATNASATGEGSSSFKKSKKKSKKASKSRA